MQRINVDIMPATKPWNKFSKINTDDAEVIVMDNNIEQSKKLPFFLNGKMLAAYRRSVSDSLVFIKSLSSSTDKDIRPKFKPLKVEFKSTKIV